MNVRDLMAQSVRYNCDRLAIVHGERRMTFAQAWDRGIRLANGLRQLGLQSGDRVAVLEDNCIEASDLFQAGAIANVVRVPLYPRNGRDAHLHMMKHTGCRVLIISEHYLGEVEGLKSELPDLEHILVRDSTYENWLAAQSDEMPDIDISPDDFFIIRHTGGTTGQAKAVGYTHKGWLAAGRDWFYIFPQVLPGDACLHVGPISHGSGYQYLPVWLAGGCNVMVDHFDVEDTLEIIEKERIGFTQWVSTMLRAIIQHPASKSRDLSSLKCILIGAAPVQDSTILAARGVFGDVLYQGYGQTEVLPIAFMGPQQWFAEVEGSSPLRACGMPLPYAQVQIWDEDNQQLPVGEIGEIVAKTDGQMSCFWNNPEATAERIVDGWIKTGDIGRIDRNGYVYLIDRGDDMIISGGYNIYPSELENVIAGHPQVIEVAVVGVPHDKWGETPCAICVVRDVSAVSEADIQQMVGTALGSYKKPSVVQFRTVALPKSPVGKIKRKDLREPFWRGIDRRISGS